MIYLDNNATSRPYPQVTAAMARIMGEHWGNPSSIHRFGQDARREMELARESVGRLLGCSPSRIIFTSGATEANNLAVNGLTASRADRPVVISTPTEHSAIREPVQRLGAEGRTTILLPVARNGLISPADLRKALEENAGRVSLVSIHWINNETGVIQPVEEFGLLCRQHGVIFHVDATQSVGKTHINVESLPIDAMSFSAHKFHGPKGIGGLYVRSGLPLKPQNLGGPHERDRRGGTENVEGIVGMGVAAELSAKFLADGGPQRIKAMRDRLEAGILAAIPEAVVNSVDAPRIWNTTNIGFPPLQSEALLLLFSEHGLCVSAGAACSSGSIEPSPILRAMCIPDPIAHGSVRFSLSHETTESEIDQALDLVPKVIGKLKQSMPQPITR